VGVLVLVLIAVAVAAGALYSWYRKQQRRQALAAFAAQNGLKFSRDDQFGILGYGFHLLRMGDGRGCENVLSGTWENIPILETDYWYYTESTDSKGNTTRSYKNFSALIADLEVNLPYVSVHRETLFSRLADHLGFHDIDLESEDFNREFQVQAENREFAFKLIDARMMQWMLSGGGGFGFEVMGSNLLVYGSRMSAPELPVLFGTAVGFRDHVPHLVWNEYGTNRREMPEGRSAP
jgi:hypothetical protein